MSEKKFRKKEKLIFIIGILILFLNLGFVLAATTTSNIITPTMTTSSSFVYSQNTQYSQPGTYNTFSSQYATDYWPILANADKCEATTDFLMFIEPGSCDPMIVRSDLLEEQNVPIFCKVDMIKLNPFIDVTQIRSVKFENKAGFGKYIAGVNFQPNQEAIYSREVFLDKPFINNVGYVVILLKRIPAEKDMPDSVNINLTGVLAFNSQGFFGTGQNDYYLQEIKDESLWKGSYKDNSAFKGAVYLRADSIYNGGATISLYQDADTKIRTFNLKVGDTSGIYYLPGFYCRGKVRVKLDDIVGGVKKVSLSVDDNSKWYVEGEKFLDNNCQVNKINLLANEKSVDISCKGMALQKLVLSGAATTKVDNSLTTPANIPIDDEIAKKIYDKAKEQQTNIKSLYGDAESAKGEMWSAQSLYDLADLAEKVGMAGEARDLFNQVATQYPGTSYGRGAADRIGNINVPTSAYNGHYIKLINIQGPTRDEVSAEFEVKKDKQIVEINNCGGISGNCNAKLSVNEEYCKSQYDKYECDTNDLCNWNPTESCNGKVQAKETFADVFKLINIYQDKVEIQYNPVTGSNGRTETFILNLNDREQTKGGYTIKLKKINFNSVAKVSLIADIPNQYSNSDFTFSVGIEKRAINLSTETAQEIINNLNKTINNLNKTVNTLGSAVKTMKGVCLATSAVLIAKNFFSGLSGGSTARQDVMPMWYDKCKREVGTDKNLFDKCLNDNNDKIENDVKVYSDKIKSVNDKVISVQKANTNSAGAVDRKNTATEFKKGVSPVNFDVEKYIITKNSPEGEKQTTSVSITQAQIDAASLTDLRDIKMNSEILNSDASDVAKNAAKLNIEKISVRLQGKTVQNTGELLSATVGEGGLCKAKVSVDEKYCKSQYDKYECINNDFCKWESSTGNSEVKWINKVNAQYFLSGTNKGLVHIVPIPGTYGEKTGFYAVVDDSNLAGTGGGYSTAGDIKEFWIQNIGADEILDVADDSKTDILYAAHGSDYLTGKISVAGLDKTASANLVNKAVNAIKTANRNYGKSRFSIDGTDILIDKSAANVNEKRCQDFMSPKDCWYMFNACDPVLCPSSRCDLGGRYKVDNVIQSGVIGSTLLCLPNAQEKIIVPVCLSGIQAGLDSYLSILQSYQDCLKENIASGKTVGICDEIHSVYLCEFFWKQAKPIVDMGVVTVLEKSNGQGMKGGGEYLTIQDAWKQASDSVDYMKNTYAVNAYNAFKARSSGNIGTEFCKAFVSASAPNKGVLDALLEPDSPVQFYAWFDEIKFTDATVPATSQYKVYYHIWAGKDIGANYQVYLRNPDTSAYVNVQQYIIVDTGYIVKGGYQSQTKDFTAPAGYKELCVRINGKDECGFKKVSTDFAINYLTDQYYASQLNANIRTKSTCISGTASAYSLIQPNVQQGVQEVIDSSTGNGNLNQVGITRICANANPGKGVNEARWKDVGYCDDESVRCWLDVDSAKQVIQDKQLETQITQTGNTTSLLDKPIVDTQTAQATFSEVKKQINNLETQIESSSDKSNKVNELFNSINSGVYVDTLNLASLFKKLDAVEMSEASNAIKAEAVYLKFQIYYVLGKEEAIYFNEKKSSISVTITTPSTTVTSIEISWRVKKKSDGNNYLIRNPARDYDLFIISDVIYVKGNDYQENIGNVINNNLDFEKFTSASSPSLNGQSYYSELQEDVNYLNGKSLSELGTSSSITTGGSKISCDKLTINMNNVELSVQFANCISVDKINKILLNSPAKNTGQVFYDLGKKYNVDPIFALAFFNQESNLGTKGIAVQTKSIGNIKYSLACTGADYNNYCQYNSWNDGIEAWYKLISGSVYISSGLNSVEKIIPVYCPKNDNCDVNGYINSVRSFVLNQRTQSGNSLN